jgi:hypothetical protein
MKAKLNVTLEPEIIKAGKRIAKKRNLSLSQLIELLIQNCDRTSSASSHWTEQYYKENRIAESNISDAEIERARKERLR